MTMKLPPGVSEAEFLEATEKVVRLLSHKYVFGYFSKEDIEQECRVLCLEALETYDPTRPLAPFIWTHCRNRIGNFKRKHYRRNDPPCTMCHAGDHSGHPDGQVCKRYAAWKARNDRKANLMRPMDLDRVADEHEPRMRLDSEVLERAGVAEAVALVDEHLPAELRSTWLRMRDGERVTKGRRQKVEAAVRSIIKEYGE